MVEWQVVFPTFLFISLDSSPIPRLRSDHLSVSDLYYHIHRADRYFPFKFTARMQPRVGGYVPRDTYHVTSEPALDRGASLRKVDKPLADLKSWKA